MNTTFNAGTTNFNADLVSAKIMRSEKISPTVRLIELAPVDLDVDAFEAGSHIAIEVRIRDRIELRHYSLLGLSVGACQIAVKEQGEGRGGSKYVCSLPVGSIVRISRPRCRFAFDWTKRVHCFIAGGIGITPLIGAAMRLARRSEDRIRFHFAASRPEELVFLDEIRRHNRIEIKTYVASEGQYLSLESILRDSTASEQIAVCGPPSMLSQARQVWSELGRPAAELRIESFGSVSSQGSFRVRLQDLDLEFEVPEGLTLLEAMEARNVRTISNCRRGECGVCTLDVVSVDGDLVHQDHFLSSRQRASNRSICPCVSRATGLVTLDTGFLVD